MDAVARVFQANFNIVLNTFEFTSEAPVDSILKWASTMPKPSPQIPKAKMIVEVTKLLSDIQYSPDMVIPLVTVSSLYDAVCASGLVCEKCMHSAHVQVSVKSPGNDVNGLLYLDNENGLEIVLHSSLDINTFFSVLARSWNGEQQAII